MIFCHYIKRLGPKKTTIPVRTLRKFKQELYEYVVTSKPAGSLRVAALDDYRVSDNDLALSIGRIADVGYQGLKGINGNDWYKDVVLGHLTFSADELLRHAFPVVRKGNSNRLPLHKYLQLAKEGSYPEAEEIAQRLDFDGILSATIKNGRACLGSYTGVLEIWNKEKQSLERATRLIAHLPESQLQVDELESVLKELFTKDEDILLNSDPPVRSHIRRLILIYDYLKWGKRKGLPPEAFVNKHPAESPS